MHASDEGGIFVVRADGTQGWITAAELDAELEHAGAAGGAVLISLDRGTDDATPAAHALHRRVVGAGLPTRLSPERHPAVTPLPEGVTRLMAFAHAGRADLVADLLERGASPEVRDQSGTTPLMYAANTGQAAVVDRLVGASADAGATDTDGTTALMYAAQRGHLEVVRILLGAGADASVENTDGLDALALAREGGHDLVVAALRQTGGKGRDFFTD